MSSIPRHQRSIVSNGVNDLLIIIADWGLTSSNADLDQNGVVDVGDLWVVIAQFGDCP